MRTSFVRQSTELLETVFDAELDRRERKDYMRQEAEGLIEYTPDEIGGAALTEFKFIENEALMTASVSAQVRASAPPPWRNTSFESNEFFLALESWEGTVEAIGEDDFVARLVPDRDRGQPELLATIRLDELDAEERKLVEVGAVFYWRVGFFQGRNGRRRESLLRFRRLPVWSGSDIEFAKNEADRLYELFGKD